MGTEGRRGAHAHMGRGAYLMMMMGVDPFTAVSMDHMADRVKPRREGPGTLGPMVPINDPKVTGFEGRVPPGLWPARMDGSALQPRSLLWNDRINFPAYAER